MEKVYIKDKQDNKVLPITHVSAVYDDEGNDLGSYLGAFEDEVMGLVSTPHDGRVTVSAVSTTTAATDVLPVSGQSADTIYRVSNWDGNANSGAGGYDVTTYSEYAWDNVSVPNKYVLLCVKTQIGEVFDISEYKAVGGTLVTFTTLSDALGTNGANVPQSLQKGGMSVKFIQGSVQSSDNKYVQFRYMSSSIAVADFTNTANWQGVDDTPTAGSDNLVKSGGVNHLIKKSQTGYTVDYNRRWHLYGLDDLRNNYENIATYDCIWISIPENAKKINVNGLPSSIQFFYFSSYEVSNESAVYFKDYQERTKIGADSESGAEYIPCFVGNKLPVVLLVNVLKADLQEGFSYDDVKIKFDYIEEVTHCESSLNGKKVSILGDSISSYATYTYWMNNGTKVFNNRYPASSTYLVNNINSVHQMWWKRLFDKCGSILEAGSCIGSSGISDNRYYDYPSYLDRYADLGNPDVILIEGFHNEPPEVSVTFNPTIATENLDTLDVGQAYDKLIRLLKATYPAARIIDVVIAPQRSAQYAQFISVSEEIDKYYDVEHIECLRSDIDYTTITSDTVHPDSDGMARIADYVIERLANNSAHVATKEYVASNTLEEKKVSIADNDVAGYITDKKKVILARINKDGSIDRIAENDRDKHTVHFEDVNIDGIVNLLVDKKNKAVASINDKGEVDFYGGGGFVGEKIIEANTGEYIRLITSKNGLVIGGIKPDGTVKLFKADIDILNHEDVGLSALINALPIIASGLDNIEISNNQRVVNLLTSVNTEHIIKVQGADIKSKLKPCISIIDDDTIDGQIPSSRDHLEPISNNGGYFSVLLPIMLSLGKKHGKNLCPGLACEGHRVGLTSYLKPNDNYSTLNENGMAVKWIHDNMGWNVFNHSMTAQLPMTNRTFYVDGIDSELAQQILDETTTYYEPYSFNNIKVLDRLTGKWYELNNQSQNAWVERVPTKKYAIPFYQDYITKEWYFNRDFDFEYNWGEWVKRADELGLPNEKVIVHNGSTSHIYTALPGRKYANWSVRTSGIYNYPPIAAMVNRTNGIYNNSDNNVRNANHENTLKGYIDKAFDDKSWVVFMTHFNEMPTHNNYYMDGVTYPDGDPNYPNEWIIPLNHSEIQDIIGDNVHDYINNPPSRLNINSWDEWHPAPGTRIKSLYDVIDYALTKGVEFVSPMQGWSTHGNMLNIGVDRNGQVYDINAQTPFTEEEQSFLTIGADGSIRYFSK